MTRFKDWHLGFVFACRILRAHGYLDDVRGRNMHAHMLRRGLRLRDKRPPFERIKMEWDKAIKLHGMTEGLV